QRRRLIGDGLDDARITVADVHAHQLAIEVDEPLALGRPEVDAPGASDGNRVDRALRNPLENGVFFRERDDFRAGHLKHASSGARGDGKSWAKETSTTSSLNKSRRTSERRGNMAFGRSNAASPAARPTPLPICSVP